MSGAILLRIQLVGYQKMYHEAVLRLRRIRPHTKGGRRNLFSGFVRSKLGEEGRRGGGVICVRRILHIKPHSEKAIFLTKKCQRRT